MSEPHLEDLPEAIPLHRVAPVWRTLALLAIPLAGMMLVFVVVLGIVIAGLRAQLRATALAAPAPPPVWVPATATTVEPETEREEPVEAVNLPYPVRDDLRANDRQVGQEEEEANSSRARFLKKGKEVWKCPSGQTVSQVAMSADGQQIAYFQGDKLIAGSLDSPQAIEKTPPNSSPWAPVPVQKPRAPRLQRDRNLVGTPAWSADGRYVYYSDAGGRVFRYDSQNSAIETLALNGHDPVPIPGNADRIVLVRSQPIAKVETPGARAEADPSEIAVCNWNATAVKLRTLVAPGKGTWHSLAVSPDGKRLAAVSDLGSQGNDSRRWRLFVGNLANGQMQALTAPAGQVSRPCWTADGKRLIYARAQEPIPPDCWENTEGVSRPMDLFEYDLEAKQETRLSRGGGFASPSLGSDGSLYFLLWKADSNFRSRAHLHKMMLAGAQQFARKEKALPARDVAAWTDLVEKVCKAAQVPADIHEGALTLDLMRRIAEEFEKTYRDQFQQDPPATEAALDRLLRQELPALAWSPAQRPKLVLVLGAVQGEYLRRKSGAEWHLCKGPLTGMAKPESSDDSVFGYAFNPFLLPIGRERDDEEGGSDRWLSLRFLSHQMEGRPLLLTNDPTLVQAELSRRACPELVQATELLKQGKEEEAEILLFDLLNQAPNRNNVYLALRVGRLLYDQGRIDALQKLMVQRCAQPPRDARQFNLLGLALLEAAPDKAVLAFKKALRCDLHFGPAYLNLAQAYHKTGDTRSASLCLKRYLDLMPYGPLASDAARRLATLQGP